MFTSRSRLIVAVSLGLLLFSSGILVGMQINSFSSRLSTQDARKTLRVSIHQDQWTILFDQFQQFADKWRYAIRIAPMDPNQNSFNVELWRADMRLTAYMDTSFDNGTVQIHFYDTDRTQSIPEQYYEEEVNDLINLLREIPNVSIIEEK